MVFEDLAVMASLTRRGLMPFLDVSGTLGIVPQDDVTLLVRVFYDAILVVITLAAVLFGLCVR